MTFIVDEGHLDAYQGFLGYDSPCVTFVRTRLQVMHKQSVWPCWLCDSETFPLLANVEGLTMNSMYYGDGKPLNHASGTLSAINN